MLWPSLCHPLTDTHTNEIKTERERERERERGRERERERERRERWPDLHAGGDEGHGARSQDDVLGRDHLTSRLVQHLRVKYMSYAYTNTNIP